MNRTDFIDGINESRRGLFGFYELDAEKIADAAIEMQKALDFNGIKYEIKFHLGGVQFRFDKHRDIILHEDSYGRENYNWESYGFEEDNGDVTGDLTVHKVIKRLLRNA